MRIAFVCTGRRGGSSICRRHTHTQPPSACVLFLDSMLPVTRFHLHFISPTYGPTYRPCAGSFCHYDDLWAEIIFGPKSMKRGLPFLPAAQKHATAFRISIQFAAKFAVIFHTWLPLLIWKAIYCHSIDHRLTNLISAKCVIFLIEKSEEFDFDYFMWFWFIEQQVCAVKFMVKAINESSAKHYSKAKSSNVCESFLAGSQINLKA